MFLSRHLAAPAMALFACFATEAAAAQTVAPHLARVQLGQG
jgi:hypothetical protein